MMTYRTVSDDVIRMAREDAIFGKEENPEMDALLEREITTFEKRFQATTKKYGEEATYDAYMEEELDFWSELAGMIEGWTNRLPNDTAFRRGCSHTLKQVKLLLDRIEALRPPEPS